MVPLVFFPFFEAVPETLVVTTVPAPGPGPCFPGGDPALTFTCADAPTAKPAISATINTIVRFMYPSRPGRLMPPVDVSGCPQGRWRL
jgi:hypothetical protein